VRKYASLEVLEAWRQAAPGDPGNGARRIVKAAHRVAFDYEPRQGYLYVRARMISSRTNDNHDTFPADEIEKGYKTFLGKPAFVNHHNANHRRARGVIVAVALHRDRNPDGSPDTWVEGLHEIDAVRFPKLCKAILAGRVNRTSMGVDVDWSTCSACGNKATSPAEYCKHLPALKGKKIRQRNKVTGKVEEKLIHEVCAGLSFFENSLLVEDPADPTAYVIGEPDARGMAKAAAKTAAGDPLRSFDQLQPHEQQSVAQYHPQMVEEGNAPPGSAPRDYLYESRQEPKDEFLDRYMDADEEFKKEYGPGDWEAHHQETLATHPVPRYPEGNRWPLIVNDENPNYVDDGYHRMHSYMRDGATHIPTVRMHPRTAGAAGDPDFRDHLGNTCTTCGQPVHYAAGLGKRGRYPWQHRHQSLADHDALPADPSDKRPSQNPTFSAGHCLVCGDPVSINLNALDKPGGGFHHGDGMKRDHLAVPADEQGAYDSVTAQKAAREQARRQMSDHMHGLFEQLEGRPLPRAPRGDERQMPPDPFTAARKKKPKDKPVRGYGRDPKFDGVALKQDRNGFYVHTHRSRSDSYPTVDDIPDKDIDYIRSTGAKAQGGDHPWFMNHPVSAHHVTAAYNDSSDDERALGDRWYSDAHHVAKVIGKGDSALGAGLLSAYSPRTMWPVNMFNASRAAQGDPPGPGSGALGDHQRKAIRILAGEHHSKVLTAPKTAAFAHLIEHGGDSPDDVKSGRERVVIDRHAMSVATGRRLTDADTDKMPVGQSQHYEHVSDAYREAARTLSEQHGRKISPHQVQAATWLRQIRKNTEEDSSGARGAGGKGRVQLGDNSRRRWVEHHHEHHPGQIPEENMHVHGSTDQPPPQAPWPVGGTHCAMCGGSLAHPGNPGGKPVSRSMPMMCQDCSGRVQGHGADTGLPGYMTPGRARETVQDSRPWDPLGDRLRSSMSVRKQAYGETRVPPQVDTLRMDECPVCGEHNVWSGSRCPVCGFVVPPSVFRDPDTDKAKEVREQLDSAGEVDVPPDQPDAGQPDAQGQAQMGSGDDADDQLVHPDQIAPDGVPTVQGGDDPANTDGLPPEGEEDPEDPEGAVPVGDVPPDEAEMEDTGDEGEEMFAEELICPACGTTFEADAAAQPGVPCPACGMAALHPVDEEPGDEEDEEEQDPGAVPPEGAEDPSDPDEEPGDEEDEEEDKDMPASKTAAALAQAQAHRIAELSAQNEVLSAQLRFLASAAGIDRELAEVGRRVMRRRADVLNPASPVPDPPQGPPTETTEQALQPETMDNAGRPGTTPGANSRVPAQQTTTAITPGVEMQTPPATNLIDVTAPVQGTNPSQDGGVPLEQRRIETDVRIDPDPLKAQGPGIGGQGDNGSAFPWILDAQAPGQQGGQQGGQSPQQGQRAASLGEADASRRTFASIRLAKLRVLAGLAQGDELAVAERIERDASLATPVIEHEIGVLSRMPVTDQRMAARPVQRTASRSVPSLASVGASSQYAPAVTDDLDASDLFD
jgi:hypothetical protein